MPASTRRQSEAEGASSLHGALGVAPGALPEKKRCWNVVGMLSPHRVMVGRRGGDGAKNECTEEMETVVCQSWICCITILKKRN